MKFKAAAVVSATLLLWGCDGGRSQESLLKPIKRSARQAVTPGPVVSPLEWRAQLRDAYRLHPDGRFLLAFGEIDRLAGSLPAPPGKAATAEFADGKWTLRFGNGQVGALPEFPDFSDYLPLLVAHAKAVLAPGSGSTPSPSSGGSQGAFLMPGLLKEMESAERLEKDGSFLGAARCWARLTFQMPDRLELAPLIPARALALFAAARARDAHAGVEEEILLAHALGYTRHAEVLAATLPADAPLRAFEAVDDHALKAMASQPGATEEVRYLAVKRSTDIGDFAHWREARERFLPGNDSVAVVATGLEIELPAQVEVTAKSYRVAEALPRAVLREFSLMPSQIPPGFESITEFVKALKGAVDAARGSLWDGPAIKAYYQAAYYSPLTQERWPPFRIAGAAGMGVRLIELSNPGLMMPPDPKGDTTGAPLLIRRMHKQFQTGPPGFTEVYAEVRALVRWLDSRPRDRFELADFSRSVLQDPRAAEDLFRSLVAVLGERSRTMRAEAALYLGDWATLHAILGSPEISAPETTAILWSWYNVGVDQERLASEYERAIERFPAGWNATNQYIDLLRSRKEYKKSCQVVERWLARNPDPKTPGHFHAHIRLAHNYDLAGEPLKGLALLQGMSEADDFQEANRTRGIAECLAAAGRTREAEETMHKALKMLGPQPEAMRMLTKILWQEGKDAEAADILAQPARTNNLQDWEVCEALEKDFSEVFAELPRDRLAPAIEAIAKKPELLKHGECVSRGFGKLGRWEDAFHAGERIAPPAKKQTDQLIKLYGYMESWKGAAAAATWLEGKVPPGSRNPLSINALYTKHDGVLWDVIGTPNPADKAEWVWLYRAVAFALRGSDGDAHHAQLLAYYKKDDPWPYHVVGRYLVGLASEADMFALTSAIRTRSDLGYYLGVRAQHEKRFRDACEWYRVAAESGEATTPCSLAMFTLGDWAGMLQGLWRLETDGGGKK